MFTRITRTIQEIRLLTPRQLVFRVGYEFFNRTGLRQRLEPLGHAPALDTLPTQKEWLASLPEDHLLWRWRRDTENGTAASVLRELLGEAEQQALIERADRAIQGQIRAFSKWEANYGDPIDWHKNPVRNISWPGDVHWSKIYGFEAQGGGDIKMVWEINRFPHVYDLARAYILTGDSRYPRAFFDQLKSWEAANPFRAGANWASGQELAIRCLSWLFGLAVMGEDEVVTDEDFHRLLRLFYLHAHQIDSVIDYALHAVHNNHLIGEALGLLVAGELFAFFPEAGKWRKKGREFLGWPTLQQFYEDGGYCQSSHTYQRLALHYLLWFHQLSESDAPEAQADLKQTLEHSAHYLASFQNIDGRLPNRGANDGALLNPWTACDFTDFRPLLTALRYSSTGHRAYPDGPWDEELFWFFGADALTAPVEPFELSDQSFRYSGIHILRRGAADFATFRCGTLRDRFAQADQLHVDIFWRGLNIAQDGGSYCYNDEPDFHRWFIGTSSHNTITVDGENQMLLHRRFKWLNWTKAYCAPLKDHILRGQHFGYSERGVIHHRQLKPFADGWEIIDKVFIDPDRPCELTLHWLLGDFPFQFADDTANNALILTTPEGPLRFEWAIKNLRTGADLTGQVEPQIARGKEAPEPQGWFSRYYGMRQPTPSFQLSIKASGHTSFITRFYSPKAVEDL